MKLLTGGKDISQLIEKITWSGDTSQVSRKINFTIAQNKKDTLFPNVSIDIGDEIIMQEEIPVIIQLINGNVPQFLPALTQYFRWDYI